MNTFLILVTYKTRPGVREEFVNYSDLYKSELPASTTTALAAVLRNSMSYTMSTGV